MSGIRSAQCPRPVFLSFVSLSSAMASGREMVPVGEATVMLYDDMSMNGSNGPACPTVVDPGDYEGSTAKMLECAFIYTLPSFIGALL